MSGSIPQSFIQDILSRTDLIEIISSRIKLIKKGRNYQARCPFHQEKTPSFTASQDKQFFYCFGCKAHGNAIHFLMQYDRMEFIEALQYLAAQHNIDIPSTSHRDSAKDSSQDLLYPLMVEASRYFQANLRHSQQAIDYLKKRGLNGETAKHFQIGFAEQGWDKLIKRLGRPRLLERCGLVVTNDRQRQYDRFRHRIIFPIRDVRGRVVAFGGRALSPDDQPKYLNSPETAIFHKSQELYGLYEAKQQRKDLTHILIVEGYMDVIALHQSGLDYAVATLGTAINTRHLQKLLRYTKSLIFCFDGDHAGQQAAWKALTLSLPLLRDGVHMRFLFLPADEDPDSLVRRIGQEAFEARLEQATPLSDTLFNILSQRIPLTTPDNKAAFAREVSEYLNTMPSGIYQQLLYEQLADRLEMRLEDVEKLKMHQSRRAAPSPSPKAAPTPSKTEGQLSPTELACSLLLEKPELANDVKDITSVMKATASEHQILLKLIQILKRYPNTPAGQIIARFANPQEQQHIATLAAHKPPIPPEGYKEEFLGALARVQTQSRQHQIDQLINKGRQNGLTQSERERLQELVGLKDSRHEEGH